MKNKGLSRVELMIVIAIMAILSASIAPSLIRYIDKSRRSDDVAAAETLNTATQAALANEDAHDEIQSTIAPAGSLGAALESAAQGRAFSAAISCPTFLEELNSSTASKAPSVKYKKNGASKWIVGVNDAGKPVVWISTSGGELELQPSIHKTYK